MGQKIWAYCSVPGLMRGTRSLLGKSCLNVGPLQRRDWPPLKTKVHCHRHLILFFLVPFSPLVKPSNIHSSGLYMRSYEGKQQEECLCYLAGLRSIGQDNGGVVSLS